jgi:hypothetical protein
MVGKGLGGAGYVVTRAADLQEKRQGLGLAGWAGLGLDRQTWQTGRVWRRLCPPAARNGH